MINLLDVNVLISLAWPNHVHHAVATSWFTRRSARSRWATTPVTEAGFVRVSANQAAIPSAVRPQGALQMLSAIRATNGHVFLADDVESVTADLVDSRLMASYRQVTDAHLLAVARRHKARFVTLDRGIKSLAAATATDVVVISPSD